MFGFHDLSSANLQKERDCSPIFLPMFFFFPSDFWASDSCTPPPHPLHYLSLLDHKVIFSNLKANAQLFSIIFPECEGRYPGENNTLFKNSLIFFFTPVAYQALNVYI